MLELSISAGQKLGIELIIIQGALQKFKIDFASTLHYSLCVGDDVLPLNVHLGQKIQVEFQGNIHCRACGRKTPKSYGQGHCFACVRSLASCDICMVRPEKCHYAQGTCREPAWGEDHCFKPHIIYLANTSGLKVGITRAVNIPMRWMDQGATQALPIFKVDTRLDSGKIETLIAQTMNDKTHWRKMLQGAGEPLDLAMHASQVQSSLAQVLTEIPHTQLCDSVIDLHYPVLYYPPKIVSLTLDKTPVITGTLLGMKGQYLILDTGVFNVRTFSGYDVIFRIKDVE